MALTTVRRIILPARFGRPGLPGGIAAAAMPVAIEELRRKPDQRGEETCVEVYLVQMARAIGANRTELRAMAPMPDDAACLLGFDCVTGLIGADDLYGMAAERQPAEQPGREGYGLAGAPDRRRRRRFDERYGQQRA